MNDRVLLLDKVFKNMLDINWEHKNLFTCGPVTIKGKEEFILQLIDSFKERINFLKERGFNLPEEGYEIGTVVTFGGIEIIYIIGNNDVPVLIADSKEYELLNLETDEL